MANRLTDEPEQKENPVPPTQPFSSAESSSQTSGSSASRAISGDGESSQERPFTQDTYRVPESHPSTAENGKRQRLEEQQDTDEIGDMQRRLRKVFNELDALFLMARGDGDAKRKALQAQIVDRALEFVNDQLPVIADEKASSRGLLGDLVHLCGSIRHSRFHYRSRFIDAARLTKLPGVDEF